MADPISPKNDNIKYKKHSVTPKLMLKEKALNSEEMIYS